MKVESSARRTGGGTRRFIRGEGRLGTVVSLMLLAAFVYAAYKGVPVVMKAYEFEEKVKSIARLAAASYESSEDKIREDILREAARIGIPLDASAIVILTSQRRVKVEVRYSITTELPGYTWKSDYHVTAQSEGYN